MNLNTTTGEVFLSDKWADIQIPYPSDNTSENGTNVYGGIKQLYLLKKANRSLKTLMGIGGATYSPNFIPILASDSLRANFAKTAISLMTNLGFDGIDVDYEYVTNSTEAAQMVDLLKKLREGMDAYSARTSSRSFLISYASPAGPEKYKQLDFKGMDQYLDFWNYMGFDYTGPWDTIAGHQANVFQDFQNPAATPFNTTSAIAYYTLVGGVSPSKINLGSPLYGRAFAGTKGPGNPFNGTGTTGSFDIAGVWDYKALPAPGYDSKVLNLNNVGASYSYDAAKKYMVSYDTPEIAKVKARFVKATRLGGSMWWEVSMDKSGVDSLIGTTVEMFGGVKGLENSQNNLNYPESIYDNLRNGM